jgi:hypothetical protein
MRCRAVFIGGSCKNLVGSVCLVYLVYSVYLVGEVHLVYLVCPVGLARAIRQTG